MIVIGADGINGEISTPMSLPERLFSQGVIVQRGLLGRHTQSITFVENGEVNIAAEAISSPKANDVIGDYTARAAYVFPDKTYSIRPDNGQSKSIEDLVNDVLGAAHELYYKKFRVANSAEASDKQASQVDVLVETVPRTGRNEFVIFRDRNDIVIECDTRFKSAQDDALQEEFTNALMQVKMVPQLKQIGYGLLRSGWAKMTRPNTYIRVSPKTVIKAQRTKNEYLKSEWQVQAFYAQVLATALQRWLGGVISAYDRKDWVALANVLISWISGTGSIDRTQMWSAEDIEVSVNNVPGLGWTKANRFLWGNVKTVQDFKMYWVICTILGFVSERIKAPIGVFKLVTVLSNNDWKVPQRTRRALEPNIPGWGSGGTYYMLMPRNNFSYGEKTDVPMPCIVDDGTFDHPEEILRNANKYEDLLPYEQQSWRDVMIDRGEVPQGAINESSTEAQFIRLHATNDARIVRYEDRSTRFMRSMIQWRFPTDQIVDNGIDRDSRLRLFLWGLLANGEKGMKNAFVIESSLDVFDPIIVRYRRGPLDSQIVEKEGTKTSGPQVSKPGTISVAPNEIADTEYSAQVKPPAPEQKPREPRKVVEVAEKGNIPETKDVESKHDSETNNRPETTGDSPEE